MVAWIKLFWYKYCGMTNKPLDLAGKTPQRLQNYGKKCEKPIFCFHQANSLPMVCTHKGKLREENGKK